MKHRKFSLFRSYNIRFLFQHKAETFLNVLAIAIGIGIMLVIQILNLMSANNIDSTAYAKIGGDIGIVLSGQKPEPDAWRTLDQLEKEKKISCTASAWNEVIAEAGERKTPTILRNIDSTTYPYYRLNGDKNQYKDLKGGKTIIISSSLATRIDAKTGDKIKIQDITHDTNHSYTVQGIAPDDGEDASDMNVNGYIFIDTGNTAKTGRISNASNIRNASNIGNASNMEAISKIYIKVHDKHAAGIIRSAFGHNKVQQYAPVRKDIAAEVKASQNANDSFGIFSIIMVLISIISSMVISTMRRKKDICLLKVYGGSNREIIGLYLREITIISTLGSILGIAAGAGLACIVARFVYSYWTNVLLLKGILPLIAKAAIFGIGLGIISGAIPVVLIARVTPMELLRNSKSGITKRKAADNLRYGLLIIGLCCVAFSLYLGSLNGVRFVALFGLALTALMALTFFILKFILLTWPVRNRRKKIGTKLIANDGFKYTIVVLTISICVAIVGIILSIGNSMLPSLQKQLKNSLGYDVFFKISRDKAREVDQLLDKKPIAKYYKSEATDFRFISISGKPINGGSESNEETYTLDSMLGKLDYINDSIVKGKPLDAHNKDKIILDEDTFRQLGAGIGDTLTIRINGTDLPFTIGGVRASKKIKTGQAYINADAIPDAIRQPDVLRYYVTLGKEDSEDFITDMNHAFKDIVVMDMSDISLPYANTIRKQMASISVISVLCILAAIFLVYNILLIIYSGKTKVFTILRLYGADGTDVRKLLVYQGIRLGAVVTIVSFLLTMTGSMLFEGMVGISINLGLLTLITIIAMAFTLTISGIYLTSNHLIHSECSNIIRSDT